MRTEEARWAVSGTAALARAPRIAPSATAGNVIPFERCRRTHPHNGPRDHASCASIRRSAESTGFERASLMHQLACGTSKGRAFDLFTRRQIAVSAVLFATMSYLVALL